MKAQRREPTFIAVGVIFAFLVLICLPGCLWNTKAVSSLAPQEIVITVKAAEPTDVEITGDQIHRGMDIKNPEGELSALAFIIKDEAFIKIYSSLTVGDVSNFWNDNVFLLKNTTIRKIHLFINSPGGDAFSGLALADEVERAKREGFYVVAHASGIIASAAVPVFAVCNERLAAPGTIFMVHETAIWKWPGRETASDIRSQNKLMDLLRDLYMEKLTRYSNLTKENWEALEKETTWFSAEEAKTWGLVDRIE